MRPLSPRVPPYIAPSMPTLASARVATAPLATMPWYRSVDRAASAIAASPLMPASTRGSSWATSATTNRQPSSATAAGPHLGGDGERAAAVGGPPPGDHAAGQEVRPEPAVAHPAVQPVPAVGLQQPRQLLVLEQRRDARVLELLERPGAGVAHRQPRGLQRAQQPAGRVGVQARGRRRPPGSRPAVARAPPAAARPPAADPAARSAGARARPPATAARRGSSRRRPARRRTRPRAADRGAPLRRGGQRRLLALVLGDRVEPVGGVVEREERGVGGR